MSLLDDGLPDGPALLYSDSKTITRVDHSAPLSGPGIEPGARLERRLLRVLLEEALELLDEAGG